MGSEVGPASAQGEDKEEKFMSSFVRIVAEVEETAGTIAAKLNLDAGDPAKSIQNIAAWVGGAAGGATGIKLHVAANAVRASLVGTFTGDPTAAQALTINGVTFTARASGAVANEFNIVTGGNAAPLAAAINASTTAKIKNIIKAVATSAQVITLYSIVPGTIGNLVTVSENFDNFTLAGGGTALAGGTEDADVQLAQGIAAETSA